MSREVRLIEHRHHDAWKGKAMRTNQKWMGIIVVLAVLLLASTGLGHARGGGHGLGGHGLGADEFGGHGFGGHMFRGHGFGANEFGRHGFGGHGLGEGGVGDIDLEVSMKASMTNRVKIS
jgi:hypothetical protein